MSERRNAFPQPNSIRRYVQAELLRRKANTDTSQFAIPTPTIMPFVRFTSTKSDPKFKYRLFHLGLHGFSENDASPDFGNIFELGYGGQDVVGYGINTTNGARIPILSTQSKLTEERTPFAGPPAEGRHPVPGITQISVEHLGANNPIRTTVNWVCYNDTQLEFLRQHFLLAGGYVVIEFGHIMSNRPETAIPFQFSNPDAAINQLTEFVIQGRKFMSDELFEKSKGNYNMVIGRVVDQSIGYQSDGTIHCSTTFYSTGEAVFGIHNNSLTGRLRDEENRPTFAKTIQQFFGENQRFDQMLQEEERIPFVIDMRSKTEKEVKGSEGDTADTTSVQEKFKSDDARFIPWEMFIRDVLTEVFAAVHRDEVSADASLFTTINKDDQPAVGNHRLLSSTDPEAMIIVKPFMVEGTANEIEKGLVDTQQVFSKPRAPHNKFFVSGSESSQDEKGLLTNGVWINTGAIKEAFHSQNTFYESMKQLLQHMSNATENYWDLDLVFDEETQQYKIYDKKCVFGNKDYPDPYLFNEANVGELLDLSFDADFSKEAKTAVLLASQTRTLEEVTAARADGKGAAAFNQPSIYTLALNIPLLRDDLGLSVYNARVEKNTAEVSKATTPAAPAAADNKAHGVVGHDVNDSMTPSTDAGAAERLSRLDRFANSLGPYIAKPSELIAAIVEDGVSNINQINNFVAPIPTEINLSMRMQGITGFAFYDTFQVDKLPRIYRDHGVFLINDIKHEVSENDGWTTEIGGLYYFVSPGGGGQPANDAVGPTDKSRKKGEGAATDPHRLPGSTMTRTQARILEDDNVRN